MDIETRNVIWVASYPKSGNTWVHDVLRTAGKAWGFPPGPMDIYDMLNTGRRPEVCPPVLPEFASNPCSVLKTHNVIAEDRPLHRMEGLELRTVGFIYVYRNPLDLLLSYVNFTRLEYPANRDNAGYAKALFQDTLGMKATPTTEEWSTVTIDDVPREALDHALGVFSERGLTLPTCFPNVPWSRHVRKWLRAADGLPSVVLKYEDCIADKAVFNQMGRFFAFGDHDIQKATGSSALRASKAVADGTTQERIFYNKMQAYYYPRYFSAGAIDAFVSAHRDVLEELGYGGIVARTVSAIP